MPRLLAQGASNDAIAEALVVTPKAVRNYVSHIYDELAAEGRSQAITLARDAGLGQLR